MKLANTKKEALDSSNALADFNANSTTMYYLPLEALAGERPYVFFFAGTMKYHPDDELLTVNKQHGALRYELWLHHHKREGFVIQDRCLRDSHRKYAIYESILGSI